MAELDGGIVYLVGAGPGDPGLATVRALELIAQADVIVHDRLVPDRLLERARPGAETVDVGKRPGGPSTSQEEINGLLLSHARAGRTVVRLKGGDPFVFGRGGEEAEALAGAGVPFEVVPGVTAGVAAPAYAGIPVTHRDAASAVAFVTGHEDPEKGDGALDWAALAAFPGTLVLYMGVRNLETIAVRLVEHGRPGDEAAAIVERGTLADQRVAVGTLATIAAAAAGEGIEAPAVTVIGPVAALAEPLAWAARGPLAGKTVAVTRARAQASELTSRLSALGASVIELPAIRIEPREDDPAVEAAAGAIAAGAYDTVCLTSANGAALLVDALLRAGFDVRALAATTVAAIGPGTERVLRERGIAADVVPRRAIAESLAQELVERGVAGGKVLVARASEARDVLPDRLREAGAEVQVVALYDTVAEPVPERALARLERADYVTFTSSSTVRNLLDAIGGASRFPESARVISIGPVTSDTARQLGLDVDGEAEQHDLDGLVSVLLADAIDRAGVK